MTTRLLFSSVTLVAALLMSGCVGALPSEQAAREQVARIGRQLPSLGAKSAALPRGQADSSFAEYARYAVLNHPAVAAGYQDWQAAVESIVPSRALPDPKFTFEADVADTLMTVMPGLMFDFMTPGKRTAMAQEATATSQIAYRAYVSAVLSVASEVRKSWIELAYVEEAIRLREASLAALTQAATVAEAEYSTGKGMATLENPIRIANAAARLRSELATLQDRLIAGRATFKATLGLLPTEGDPVWPHPVLVVTKLPSEEELWHRILSANPELARMRAMVDMAMANVAVARTAGTPDFSLGAMADLQASPLMVRPTAQISLPVWRGKIASILASAEARRDAAVARVMAEQLTMAAQLAQMLYMVRESDRMIAYLDDTALPGNERVVATVEAGYQSGMTGLAMIPETKLMSLGMLLERAAALRDRETAVNGLLLMVSDVGLADSPLLTESGSVNP